MIERRHEWDALRHFPTEWARGGIVHESVFRSYQVLRQVEHMLMRGDSADTVLLLIEFARADGNTMAPRPTLEAS